MPQDVVVVPGLDDRGLDRFMEETFITGYDDMVCDDDIITNHDDNNQAVLLVSGPLQNAREWQQDTGIFLSCVLLEAFGGPL